MTRLITLAPGHFHAALVQKEMYARVDRRVHIYAPLGPDLLAHLGRIHGFNSRQQNPTAWELDIHTGPDFLERMLAERAGNVVVLSGRNRGKIDYLLTAVEAGFHVLADKPWIIVPEDLPKVDRALRLAEERGLVAYDIMTERYEITSILQRALANDEAVFGKPVAGTPTEPGVFMEGKHFIMKLVAGVPNRRPTWFFDTEVLGEGLTDTGTHLVDLVMWILFPDRAIDHTRDVEMVSARRWPTTLTRAELEKVTGEPYTAESLDYFCNTSATYRLRGVHVRLDVLWDYESKEGHGDTHIAIFRGNRSRVEVRQGREQNWRPELYVVPAEAGVGEAVRRRVAALQKDYPGVSVTEAKGELWITIPDVYRVGHEAHFAQVTRQFLEYLKAPASMPAWERPNMLAKYHVTTAGVRLAQKGSSS